MDIKKVKSLLANIEWIYDGEYDEYFCPSCNNLKWCGHKPDCELMEVIKELNKN